MATASGPLNTIVREGDIMPLALAAVKVYRGAAAAVVQGVGYGTPLVAASTTTQTFAGVFEETYDNTAGSAGGYFTKVRRNGCALFSQTGTTISHTSIGVAVYFSDDNTVTLSAVTNATGVAQLVTSASIAANLLAVGDRIRVRGQIVGTTQTGSDTCSVRLGANTSAAVAGVTALFTLATAFAHATTNFLFFDVELVVQSIGATGAVLGGGIVSGGTAGATLLGVNVGSTTVATNAALYLVLGLTFSASNTTDQVTVNIFDVDVIRHQ